MMCFAINKATEFINPTKGLEYMATGKPIVSTHVKDVVNQWSDIVLLANGAEEFVEAAEQALTSAGDVDERVAARPRTGASSAAGKRTVAEDAGPDQAGDHARRSADRLGTIEPHDRGAARIRLHGHAGLVSP